MTRFMASGSITVVIPCYNYGRYLQACVESVLSQGVDVRVSIIDDCSSDDTEAVGLALSRAHPSVTFHRHQKNAGHILTYNEGLGKVETDYVLLLSADDLLAPGSLQRAIDVLDTHPDVALVYGDVVEFSDVPPVLDQQRPADLKVWAGPDFIFRCCSETWNPICTPTAVVRSSAQKAVGGYRTTLPHSGDREMWLRLATQGNVAELAGPVQAFYRQHDTNMHRQWFYDPLVNDREMRRAYETFFDDYGSIVMDLDRIRTLFARRMAERGVWWAFQKLKRGQVLGAATCLRFAASVWNDVPETAIGMLDTRQLTPVRHALRERRRRRLRTRSLAGDVSSAT